MTDRTPGDAVLQRDGKTYGLVVGGAGGVVTPEQLERVARVADARDLDDRLLPGRA